MPLKVGGNGDFCSRRLKPAMGSTEFEALSQSEDCGCNLEDHAVPLKLLDPQGLNPSPYGAHQVTPGKEAQDKYTRFRSR
jgi:hypothetical protein